MGSKASHQLRGKQLHPVKHIGFEGAAEQIAERENLPMDRARAILAAGARNASAAAKRRNPRLKRVKN